MMPDNHREEKDAQPNVIMAVLDAPMRSPARQRNVGNGLENDQPAVAIAVAPANDVVIVDLVPAHVECTICYEALGDGVDLPLTTLACMHVFHRHCISRWLQGVRQCPLCRTPVALDVDDRDGVLPEMEPVPEVAINMPDDNVGWGAPRPPSPLNNSAAVGHHQVVPTIQNIRVPVRIGWVNLKWTLLVTILCLLICGGFNLPALILAVIFGFVLRPICRLGVSMWRGSSLRNGLLVPRVTALDAPLTTQQMNELMVEHLNDPVVELNPPPLVTLTASADSAIQRAAVFMGLTEQVMTGQLVLHGRYSVPATAVDFRPTNYIGTTASSNIVEVCVSHIDNIHDQTTSLVFWSPEMVGQLMSSSRYIPAAQRALELGPRSSRITDQQLQSTFYSEIQAGSARVALIRASSSDMTDIHARSTVLDFRSGSPSTPCMASDIVPKMGAPFLLFLGMMLTSSFVQTSMLGLCVYLCKLVLGLF